MSTDTTKKDTTEPSSDAPKVANERPKFGPQGRSHGPMGPMGAAAEKAVSFGPSLKRLLGNLRPVPLLPGRGRLITRDRGTEMIQTAWTEPSL